MLFSNQSNYIGLSLQPNICFADNKLPITNRRVLSDNNMLAHHFGTPVVILLSITTSDQHLNSQRFLNGNHAQAISIYSSYSVTFRNFTIKQFGYKEFANFAWNSSATCFEQKKTCLFSWQMMINISPNSLHPPSPLMKVYLH